MHKEHIEKQSLFDNGMEQEHAIEIATSQITQSFHRCQKLIQAISRKSGMSASQADQRLGKSAASAAARDLQDLSMMFRKSQASYLKRKFTVVGFVFSPFFFFFSFFFFPFDLPAAGLTLRACTRALVASAAPPGPPPLKECAGGTSGRRVTSQCQGWMLDPQRMRTTCTT